MKTTAGSAARAGGGALPAPATNSPAPKHPAAAPLQVPPPPGPPPPPPPTPLHPLLVPRLLVRRGDGATSLRPHPVRTARHVTEGEFPCNKASNAKHFDPEQCRFEHGTGAHVKALGGRSRELEQQRALSVAKKKTGRHAARSLLAIATGRGSALLLDLRELAHLVGRHAELDIVAIPGEAPFGDGDEPGAEAEEAAGPDVDALDRAVRPRADALHRADLAPVGGEYGHAQERIGLARRGGGFPRRARWCGVRRRRLGGPGSGRRRAGGGRARGLGLRRRGQPGGAREDHDRPDQTSQLEVRHGWVSLLTHWFHNGAGDGWFQITLCNSVGLLR